MADSVVDVSRCEDVSLYSISASPAISSPIDVANLGLKSFETQGDPVPSGLGSSAPPAELTVGDNERNIEVFDIQEPCEQVPATPQWMHVLRQTSCYLSLYIAGYKYVYRISIFAAVPDLFLTINSAGVTGTLLPSIEKQYHLTYATVSLLFVSYCIGYLISASCSGKAIKK